MPDVSILMAFTAGLISFLSPCVLPLVPGYISFVSGVTFTELKNKRSIPSFLDREKRIVLINSLFFVAGFSLIFILLGATATWIGPILGVILTYAGTLENVKQGIVLLLIYSLGLGVPFLLTALAINHFWRFFKRIKKYLGLLEVTSGVIMVILGAMIFFNKLFLIQSWLPFLNKFAF